MSRSARLTLCAVVGATVLLDVVAYLAYRNTVDGQAALPNAVITVVGIFAIAVVWDLDRMKRRRGVSQSGPPGRLRRYLRRAPAVFVGIIVAWEIVSLIVSHL